jgi:threonine dehydratase
MTSGSHVRPGGAESSQTLFAGLPIGPADVRAAASRLAGVAHRTPVFRSRTADERTGASLLFKCENLQRAGAFKFRGAYNTVASLTETERRAGVVAFSSGNHAQAVALAARELGTSATIVMPEDAPAGKLAATAGYGAEIVRYDRYTQDRAAIAADIATRRGLTLIPPFDLPTVMAGQGTAALELIEDAGVLDRLYVCVGGGGLLSGCAVAARMLAPGCEVVGVEPEAGDDVRRSLEAGHIVSIDVPHTIADGAQTQAPGQKTFAVIERLVSRIETVTDEELVQTMRWFAERMKLVVEPTGCLAAAAALRAADITGLRVGVIISGGNVDLARFAALTTQSSSAHP